MARAVKRRFFSTLDGVFASSSTENPSRLQMAASLGLIALIGAVGAWALPSAAQSQVDANRAQAGQPPVRASAVSLRVVSNDVELQQALQSISGPTEIHIQPGRYGVMHMRNVEGGGRVTITAADPNNRPLLAGLLLHNVTGVNISHLNFSRYIKSAREDPNLFRILSSSDILAENLIFQGVGEGYDLSVVAATLIRNSNNITFQKNYFSFFRHGLELRDVDHTTIRLNEFTDMRTDAIRGGGVNNTVIENNVAARYHPQPEDHVDGIQLWSTHQTKPARNIFIRDNLVVRDGGGKPQGIFIRDTELNLPFENIEITGNLLIGTLWHGIGVTGLNGGVIAGNEVISHPTQRSWIKLTHSGNIVFEDNKAEIFLIENTTGKISERKNRKNARSDRNLPQRISQWVNTKPGFAEYRGPVLRRLMQE